MTNIIILLAVLVSASLTIFLLNAFVRFKLKNKLPESETPITIPIFKGVLFISAGLLLSELFSTFQTLTKILPGSYSSNDLLLREISFYCIFFAIVLIVFAVLVALASLLFSLINKKESIFIEVANNNLQSLLLFSGILLALTFAVKTGMTPLLDEFIPYPKMPVYR